MPSVFQGNTVNLSASGPVTVSSIVKMDPANPYCVIQATGPQDLPVGIAQQGSFNAPGVFATLSTLATNSQTPPTGKAPNPLVVYAEGSVCRLQLSPACNAIIPGQLLCSDANGLGIDLANLAISGLELDYAVAIALTVGAANQFIRVLVIAPFGVSGVNRFRVSLTPALIGGTSVADQNFAIPGLQGSSTAAVVVSGEALTAGLGIVNARITGAGSLQIRFLNITANSITPAAQFFDIGVIA